MIYNHIINDEFYRLEEDISIDVSWLKLHSKTAGLLGLTKSSYGGSYYEGSLILPKGTIIQIYTNGFRVIKSFMGKIIKQISIYHSSRTYNLKHLNGKEITHLTNNDDIFEKVNP